MVHRLKPPVWLALYLVAVVATTFVHRPSVLAVALVLALLAAGERCLALLRRTVWAVLAFNVPVSLGYLAFAPWQDAFSAQALLLINLRVLLLVFLGFWLRSAVDLLAMLAPFPLLRLVATLALGQMRAFERVIRDFQMAFVSRNPARPRWLARTRHAAAQAQTLMDKSMASATEAALAMRSRGAFDD